MARRFNPRSKAPRRQTDWIGGFNGTSQVETTLAANTALIVASFDTRTTGQTPAASFTIVRQRGIISFSAAVALNNIVGAYGICVVNGEAFDAGVASIISPWSEAFDDRWLYHTYFTYRNGFADATGFQTSKEYVIDGKGQRKMELGDVMVIMLENAAGDACNFMHNVRTLVKVH